MKKATITTVLQGCKGPQGRTRLAVLIGGVAMLLLLLSELMPTGTKSAAASTAPQEIAAYQTQLENRLETLIAQMDGAGKTTVMLTLETGEETIYALDTQSGQMQEQQTHVLLEDGSALAETIYQRRSAAWPCCATAGEMSAWQHASRRWWERCWICHPIGSVWNSASHDLTQNKEDSR